MVAAYFMEISDPFLGEAAHPRATSRCVALRQKAPEKARYRMQLEGLCCKEDPITSSVSTIRWFALIGRKRKKIDKLWMEMEEWSSEIYMPCKNVQIMKRTRNRNLQLSLKSGSQADCC
jgi:hypothetical protein